MAWKLKERRFVLRGKPNHLVQVLILRRLEVFAHFPKYPAGGETTPYDSSNVRPKKHALAPPSGQTSRRNISGERVLGDGGNSYTDAGAKPKQEVKRISQRARDERIEMVIPRRPHLLVYGLLFYSHSRNLTTTI